MFGEDWDGDRYWFITTEAAVVSCTATVNVYPTGIRNDSYMLGRHRERRLAFSLKINDGRSI